MREKRNQLLNETDKEMVLHRLDLYILKEEITAANIVKGLKEFFDSIKKIFSSDMAKYRQELRDVPQQEGFPYDIKWPEKPAELQGYLMDQVQANQQQQNEKVDGNQDTIILE